MSKLINYLKYQLKKQKSTYNQMDFLTVIDRINLSRVKVTIILFLVLEIMMLIFSIIFYWKNLSAKPTIYYLMLYTLMIIVMIGFGIFFRLVGKDVTKNHRLISIGGVFFISFILIWCATISLLDQLSNTQVVVYVIAIVSIATVPLFRPHILLTVYCVSQAYFLNFLPFMQENQRILFANIVNTTSFVILAWGIALMRYKKQKEDFYDKKLIEAQNQALNRINQELLAANQKLEVLSLSDGLTGIYNYMKFKKQLDVEWERTKEERLPLSMIMLDIDNFKTINDSFGHQVGDMVIKQVANILTRCLKKDTDIVARYGGDEFVLVLPNTSKEEALALACEIRKCIEERTNCEVMNLSGVEGVTISLGVNTTIPTDNSSIEVFLNIVDQALYKAKVKRNHVVFAEEDVNY